VDDTLFIGVDGGKGHELIQLAATQRNLGLPGKLVLQGLSTAICQVP
jgi:hypothetical protein